MSIRRREKIILAATSIFLLPNFNHLADGSVGSSPEDQAVYQVEDFPELNNATVPAIVDVEIKTSSTTEVPDNQSKSALEMDFVIRQLIAPNTGKYEFHRSYGEIDHPSTFVLSLGKCAVSFWVIKENGTYVLSPLQWMRKEVLDYPELGILAQDGSEPVKNSGIVMHADAMISVLHEKKVDPSEPDLTQNYLVSFANRACLEINS